MKHSVNKLFIMMLSAIIVTSCSTKKKADAEMTPQSVKPTSTAIEGYLGDYLQVVDGTYKAEKDNQMIFSWIVKVKVKAIKPYSTDDDYGLKDGNHGPLYLDLYDDKNTPVTGFDNLASNYQDDSKLADILKKGSGETWVTFSKFHDYGKEEMPNSIVAFAISSKKVEKQKTTTTSDKGSNNKTEDLTASSSGSGDWDKLLDDYEAYMDDYIKLIKKANDGDMSAAGEYPALMQKAQKLDKSLKEAQSNNNLSAEQIGRMVKIETKMLKAASEMQAKK